MNVIAFARRVVGHLFLDRSYAGYYSATVWEQKYRSGYDLDVAKEDGRYGALVNVLLRYQREGPILDAGCGDGVLQMHVRRASAVRMVGIDYAPKAIEAAAARAIPGCEFVCSDYRSFAPGEKYTVIVLNEALYYIDDYMEALRMLARHLAPGGVFVVSMFDTLVTARIWRALRGHYEPLQGIRIRDEGTGQSWRIRVLKPA